MTDTRRPICRLMCRLALAALLLAPAAQADAQQPIPVRTQLLGELLSPQRYSAPATVKPFNRPQLAAEVTGRILHMPVRVGEQVSQDQLLVELDCRVHEQREKTAAAATSRARAQRQLADAQLQRAQNLKRNSSISEELLDQRRTELLSAQAELRSQQALLQLAQIDVERCHISAPFDALVSQRLASEGGLANPGTPLLELVQLSQLEVSAEVRAHEADTLAEANGPSFLYQQQRYPLRLRALPPLIDERSRTREARLQFSGESAPVGAAGRLVWSSRERLLPAHYLVRRGEQLGVFVARAGKAAFVALPAAREGQPAAVALADDERLITEGRQRLGDGDPIEILGNGEQTR